MLEHMMEGYRAAFIQSDADRAGELDAPSWLWASIVEPTCAHEQACLDRCRRYALLDQAP